MAATMTPDEVAQDLHLSRYTVVQHLRSGHILGGFQVVPGGPWRVDADTYAAWKTKKAADAQPHDEPFRIAPRSARSRAAQERHLRA